MKIAKIIALVIVLATVGYFDYTIYNSLYHFLGACLIACSVIQTLLIREEINKLYLTFKRWLGL